jgi:uncharacterized membrane protein
MNADRRTRWLAGGVLVLTFFAGVGIGGTAVYARLFSRQQPATSFAPRHATVLGTGTFLPPGYAELGLTADQRRAVRAILENTRPHTDSILRETLPAMREAMDTMQAQLRAVLTPEQRRRLDEMPAATADSGPSTMRGPFRVQEP